MKRNHLVLSLFMSLFILNSCTKVPPVNEVLTTDGVSAITATSATVKGTNLLKVNKFSIQGVCWSSTKTNPTIDDSVSTVIPSTGAFSVTISGLAPFTTYYVRAYAIVDYGSANRVVYANVLTFKTLADPVPVIGSHYQGGILYYILKAGDIGYVAGETHGLIAATVDQADQSNNFRMVWWNPATREYLNTGATGTAIGTGKTNTAAIIMAQGPGDYSAAVCRAYTVVENGVNYNDWFLPSIDELEMMYFNIGPPAASPNTNIGNFRIDPPPNPGNFFYPYQSSTEFDRYTQWSLIFRDGQKFYDTQGDKGSDRYVRAARAF